MSKEAFFLGEPVQFKPGIMIYPPKVKDVVANDHYGVYSRILTYSQEEVEDEFLEANKGVAAKVLFESTDKNGMMEGYTGNYIRVSREFDPELIGKIVDVVL